MEVMVSLLQQKNGLQVLYQRKYYQINKEKKMAKTYQYCVAENWGKGFIDHEESSRITFKGYPGDVWQIPAYNKHGNLWIAKVAGAVKTKDEAQTIVNAEIKKAQDAWDANNEDGESADEKIERIGRKPQDITLEE